MTTPPCTKCRWFVPPEGGSGPLPSFHCRSPRYTVEHPHPIVGAFYHIKCIAVRDCADATSENLDEWDKDCDYFDPKLDRQVGPMVEVCVPDDA